MRRGWCPGLFEPMPSGDGLLLRIKPPRGRLTATQARLISAATRRRGNGLFNLTSRGNLQLRGFDADGAVTFAEEMIAAGLASQDPGEERRRNLITPPLADADDSLVAALEQVLADPALASLPPKIGLLLDRDDALADITADLRIECRLGMTLLRLDRSAIGWVGDEAAAPAAVHALLAAFLKEGQGSALDPLGPEALDPHHLSSGFQRPRAFGGVQGQSPWPSLRLRDIEPSRLLTAAGLPASNLPPPAAAAAPAIGANGSVVTLELAFGQGPLDLLDTLADLAERHGDAVLRLSPRRHFLLAEIADAAPVLRHAAAAGLIVNANDPHRRLTACTGAPRCSQASVDVQADAHRLAFAATPLPALHLSGCAKGCAHPAPSAVTLVGRAGRYDLVRQGRADATPERTGLTLAEAITAIAA